AMCVLMRVTYPDSGKVRELWPLSCSDTTGSVLNMTSSLPYLSPFGAWHLPLTMAEGPKLPRMVPSLDPSPNGTATAHTPTLAPASPAWSMADGNDESILTLEMGSVSDGTVSITVRGSRVVSIIFPSGLTMEVFDSPVAARDGTGLSRSERLAGLAQVFKV